MRQRGVVWGASALGLAVVLSLSIVGLRLSDGNGSDRHRDPTGTLAGFDVPAQRISVASFVTDLAVAPGGEIFFAEHLTGRIGVLTPAVDGFEERTVAEVSLPPLGRLFHLVLHPEWPQQPYLYYSAQEGAGASQRLALFRVRIEDFEAAEVTRMVGGLPTEDPARGPEADHFGSALTVCGGSLFLSVGDADSPGPGSYRRGGIRFRSQQLEFAEGKILRYSFAGADLAPAGELAESPPIFALGLRNVFAMDCDPRSGWPIAADNGFLGNDQLRLIEPGTNHGWPDSDERLEPTAPLLDTGRASIAPTGVVARDRDGRTEVLFSSFHTEAIYRVRFDDQGARRGPIELVHRAAGPVLSMAQGPDGCAYFTTADAIWVLSERSCGVVIETAAGAADAGRFDGSGESSYAANCVACHGASRQGGAGPTLNAEALTQADDFYIRTILEGRPAQGMPAWGNAGMTEEQARRLLEFLRSPAP